MKRALIAAAVVASLAVVAVAVHVALIEVGREVVTLRMIGPDGELDETRLWIVDDAGSSWLHSGGEAWVRSFATSRVVEIERGGEVRQFRAHAVPGPHDRVHDLMRKKYGLADRWVRFIGPDNESTLAVRLDPL
ncbi:MAG TPA: hypothetical protein VFT98_13785 [Myxococcota bacterium]|nr:hypothetical protein [Myxococcota bacterium]